MSKSTIEWTEHTWNITRGCSRVSAGCSRCYAERVATRFGGPGGPYEGLTKGGRWTGEVRLVPEMLDRPLRWRKPRTVFVNSMSDLFHKDVPFEFIAAVFGVMAATPRHTYQVLTKRPGRMVEFFRWLEEECARRLAAAPARDTHAECCPPKGWSLSPLDHCIQMAMRQIRLEPGVAYGRAWPLPNVWLGTSVEDQATADGRIPLLLQVPAAVRFVSAEPLLGAVDLRHLQPADPPTEIDALGGTHGVLRPHGGECARLDWCIVGGESGPGARPMHPDWARSIRDQCQAAGVAFFFKQHGEWAPIYDRDRDDPEWWGVPEARSDGERWVNLEGGRGFHGARLVFMRRVGKKAAGRLLDGRTWDEMPEARHD